MYFLRDNNGSAARRGSSPAQLARGGARGAAVAGADAAVLPVRGVRGHGAPAVARARGLAVGGPRAVCCL